MNQQNIDQLPKHYRLVIEAADGKKSYAKLAEELKLPIGTVKSRLNRARKAIKKMQEQAT